MPSAEQNAGARSQRSQANRSGIKQRTVRLQPVEKWPIVGAFIGAEIWEDRIGYLTIARREPGGEIVFAAFLVDLECLGVKNALWDSGAQEDFEALIRDLGQTQTMRTIEAAYLVKIVKGAVECAQDFGFPAHPDYQQASKLFAGIDPSTCREEVSFGSRPGEPRYIRGPFTWQKQLGAVTEYIRKAEGSLFHQMPCGGVLEFPATEEGLAQLKGYTDKAN
jgi:hypothetical protein